ncbi:AraC family transcriptional regulator [Bacillus licheniformis]|nr:AraC family transcriptional regulator [Bacillus licheniformis]
MADRCHISPFHLQRTFKRIKGVSPAEYTCRKGLRKRSICLLIQNDRSQKSLQW